MDINKIVRKIANETNNDMVTAEKIAQSLEFVHPDLSQVVAAWVLGNELPFEFKGISLDAIRERDKCSFVSAVLTMSFLLKKPQYADGFLTRKMTVEDAGG